MHRKKGIEMDTMSYSF